MTETARDTGLTRVVGTWGLAAGIVNTVVGAGIFAVPATLAASIGPCGPLAFLVCGVAVGSVALCFAEAGSRVPTSGGAYGSVEAAFGPFAGCLAGVLLGFSNILASSGVAAALGDVVVSTLPVGIHAIARAIVIVTVISFVAWVNLGGVERGARLIKGAAVVKLVPLLLFLLVGASAVHGANLGGTTSLTTTNVGRALILAVFAFAGMETPLSASGEVKDPARTIPRALLLALPAITLLYVLVQVVALGILGPALATSSVPLADAMTRVSPVLRIVMLAGAALSMFGWIGGDLLGTPRLVLAFARDGMLPRALGRVSPRTHVPDVAIVGYAIVAIALALSGTFAELAILSTLSVAPLYIGVCAAAVHLSRRNVADAGPPLGFRGITIAAALGSASMLVVVALASAAEIAGLVTLLVATSVLYGARRRILAARLQRR